MGGRGTYAKGNTTEQTYKVVGYIEDVKVLEGIGKNHSLPVESHSSWAYIKLRPDGTFHEMRIYDDEHYLVKEIAYHPEQKLNKVGIGMKMCCIFTSTNVITLIFDRQGC